jgi:cell division protein FtsZ
LQEAKRLEPVPAQPAPEPVITLRLEDERPANGATLDQVEHLEPAETRAPIEARSPIAARVPKKEAAKEADPANKPTPQAAPKAIEARQEVLQFDAVSRGRFEKSEPTIIDGQDLDVPTFLRRRVKGGLV